MTLSVRRRPGRAAWPPIRALFAQSDTTTDSSIGSSPSCNGIKAVSQTDVAEGQSGRDHAVSGTAFEQVLVPEHESTVVDLEIGFESGRHPEVDVPHPVRPGGS